MKSKSFHIVSAIILMISGSLSAQTEMGNFLVGELTQVSVYGPGSNKMTLGYSTIYTKSDANQAEVSYHILSANLIPKAGYFVMDHLLVGLDLTFSAALSKSVSGDEKYNRTIYTAGPFIRYYLPVSKIYPFAELSGSFGNEIIHYEGSADGEYKTGLRLLSGGLGVAFPVGEKVMFDLLAGYSSYRYKARDYGDDNRREVTNSLGLKFGFSFFL